MYRRYDSIRNIRDSIEENIVYRRVEKKKKNRGKDLVISRRTRNRPMGEGVRRGNMADTRRWR